MRRFINIIVLCKIFRGFHVCFQSPRFEIGDGNGEDTSETWGFPWEGLKNKENECFEAYYVPGIVPEANMIEYTQQYRDIQTFVLSFAKPLVMEGGTHSNLKGSFFFFFKLDNRNEDLQDLLEPTPKKKKDIFFIIGD